MPRVTIDGRSGEFSQDTTILAAASTLGCDIPSLCTVQGLSPDPVCRICSVEVTVGEKTSIQTACSRPVQEGMIVRTDSERVVHHRKLLIQMLLARNPKVQAVKDLAKANGVSSTPFKKTLPEGTEPDDCILCGRCVRACREISQAEVLGYMGRGFDRRVALPFDEPADTCISCAACASVCPTGCISIEDEEGRELGYEELQLGPNSAIRVGTYQAVPNRPFVDPDSCIHLNYGGCGVCATVCDQKAVDLEATEQIEELQVGSVIVATGFQTFDPSHLSHFGYGQHPNVTTILEMEQMLNAAGPTGGKVKLPDGSTPERIAFVHCIGSRDKNEHEYCSRVCCMVALKQAHLVKERTGAEVYSFYIDLRCFGKGYEEFYHRVINEGVRCVRGKVASVDPGGDQDDGPLVVRAEDTLIGQTLSVPVDMVVLAVGLEANSDATDLARKLGLSIGKDGWYLEQHPKLGPVSTPVDGLFLAGACQGPKDIPDAVAQGLAAAGKAISLADRGVVEIEGTTAFIDDEICAGCQECLHLCPSKAIVFDEKHGICVVEERICLGCGACAAQCRSGAATAKHFTNEQILAEIDGVLR